MSTPAPVPLSEADLPHVHSLFHESLSCENVRRKAAEDGLQSLMERPGFLSLICDIASSPADVNIRLCSLIISKSVIDKTWRKRGMDPRCISDEEKALVRSKLMGLLGQSDYRIGMHAGIAISKIARIEFPSAWPDLMTTILGTAMQSACSDSMRRIALHTSLFVLKEISSRRLIADVRVFQGLAPSLLPYLSALWTMSSSYVMSTLSSSASGWQSISTERLHCSILATKCLRRLILNGIPEYSSIPDCDAFLTQSHAHLSTLHAFISSSLQSSPSEAHESTLLLIARFGLSISKTIEQIQDKHCIHFKRYLYPYLTLSMQQLFSLTEPRISTTASSVPLISDKSERWIVSIISFLSNVVTCLTYKAEHADDVMLPSGSSSAPSPTSIEESKASAVECNHLAHRSFFSQEATLQQLLQCLVGRCMRMTASDWQEMEEEPEIFAKELEMDNYETEVRPAADRLIIFLLRAYKDKLAPLLLSALSSAFDGTLPASSTIELAALKDSLLAALGHGSYELQEAVDFQSLYMTRLQPELMAACADPIGTRTAFRLVWLIGKWVEKFDRPSRQHVYTTLLTVLQHRDLVIRLTAIKSLKAFVYDFQFYREDFQPFLEQFVALCIRLINDCEDPDTKATVLSMVTMLIESMDSMILPHVAHLAENLALLWRNFSGSREHAPLRSSVVRASTKLVDVLGSHSAAMHTFAFPLVQFCTDPSNPDTILFLEDGLSLLQSLLKNAAACSPELLRLFAPLPELMSRDFHNLAICLDITESYILIGKAEFLSMYATQLSQSFLIIAKEVKERGVALAANVMDVIIQLFPRDGALALRPVLVEMLSQMIHGKEVDIIKMAYSCLLARLALHDTEAFAQLLEHCAASSGGTMTSSQLLIRYIEISIDGFDTIAKASKRKLLCLALLALLSASRDTQLLQGIGMIINVCLMSISELDADPKKIASLVWTFDREPDEDGEPVPSFQETEIGRKKELARTDPVMSVDLRTALFDTFGRLQAAMGGADAWVTHLRSVVDYGVLEQLEAIRTAPLQESASSSSSSAPAPYDESYIA